jgi:hypothetical protein
MEEPQHLDYLTSPLVADPEDDEMAPPAAMAGDMQCEESLGDVVAVLGADHVRAAGERLQCARERFGIHTRLRLAKPLDRPAQDVLEIDLAAAVRRTGQGARSRRHLVRVLEPFWPIVASAIEARCRLSPAGDANRRNRPASMSAMPMRAASRNALRRTFSPTSWFSRRRSPSRSNSLAF